MDLTPREKDKLLIFTAALLAERRKGRGLKPAATTTCAGWLVLVLLPLVAACALADAPPVRAERPVIRREMARWSMIPKSGHRFSDGIVLG